MSWRISPFVIMLHLEWHYYANCNVITSNYNILCQHIDESLFCLSIALQSCTYQHIHAAIAVAFRICNLSFVAIRSNFRRVSTKNEGNSRLSGARKKTQHHSVTKIPRYICYSFIWCFFFLAFLFFALVFIYMVSHLFVSITLFTVNI